MSRAADITFLSCSQAAGPYIVAAGSGSWSIFVAAGSGSWSNINGSWLWQLIVAAVIHVLKGIMPVLRMWLSYAWIFHPPTAHGAHGQLLGGLVVAERALRRDEVPLLAFPHLHGHHLRLPQGVLGLVGHVSFCFVPAHYL